MNRFIALFILLLTFATASAQTIVFSDNFDSYTADSTLSASNPSWWSTWGGFPEQDGTIVNNLAASAPNSLHISNANDQVFFVKPVNASTNSRIPVRNGHYAVSFNYYVPSQGPGAYFNVQHYFADSWAFATYFRNNGTGYFIAVSCIAGRFFTSRAIKKALICLMLQFVLFGFVYLCWLGHFKDP